MRAKGHVAARAHQPLSQWLKLPFRKGVGGGRSNKKGEPKFKDNHQEKKNHHPRKRTPKKGDKAQGGWLLGRGQLKGTRKATMLKEEDHWKVDNQDLEEGNKTQGGGSPISGWTRPGKRW
jgi:hypothetical protein